MYGDAARDMIRSRYAERYLLALAFMSGAHFDDEAMLFIRANDIEEDADGRRFIAGEQRLRFDANIYMLHYDLLLAAPPSAGSPIYFFKVVSSHRYTHGCRRRSKFLPAYRRRFFHRTNAALSQ